MTFTLANKNPFSTFDFLGYFFPGALFVSLMYILTKGIADKCVIIDVIPQAMVFLKSLVSSHIGVGVFLFVLFSYITGHLLAYVSSITVELFYTWYYGYPTSYLLKSKKSYKHQFLLNSKLGFTGMLGHLLVSLFLLPILIGHFLFERLLGMNSFIGRNLDEKLISSISDKVKQVCQKIGYNDATVTDADVHRVVMHYVYEHCQMHQVKFDNYVALYGLLRSVSFTFCLATFWQLSMLFLQHQPAEWCCLLSGTIAVILCAFLALIILLYNANKVNKADSIKCEKRCRWGEKILIFKVVLLVILLVMYFISIPHYDKEYADILLLLFMTIATYISYLGFAKFYRRFTLENYMALLTYEFSGNSDSILRLKTEEPLSIKIDHPSSFLAELYRAYQSKRKGEK